MCLRAEDPGHHVVGLALCQRVGVVFAEHLGQAQLAEIGLRALGITDHVHRRAEVAAGLELRRRQVADPALTQALGLLGLREPSLGDLIAGQRPLLVDHRLVIALGQYLGLAPQGGQLKIRGGKFSLLSAERGLMPANLTGGGTDLSRARRTWIAVQPPAHR